MKRNSSLVNHSNHKFIGKSDYTVSDAVYFTRYGKGIFESAGGRLSPPVATINGIASTICPKCLINYNIEFPKKIFQSRKASALLQIFAAFWFHAAAFVFLANMGTITQEILPEEPRIAKEKPIEVVMNLSLPMPAGLSQNQEKAATVKAIKAIPKLPLSSKTNSPNMKYSQSNAPSVPKAIVRADAGGSAAPKSASAASRSPVKSLDFLSSFNSKAKTSLALSTQGTMEVAGGKNYDKSAKALIGAGGASSGLKIGTGKDPSGVGSIRTGGKLARGNGLGLGKGTGVGGGNGTGVQAKVSAQQVRSGVAGGMSVGTSGGLEASGPGNVSESAVLGVIRKNIEKFTYCYEKALLRDASLSGILKMAWTIDTSGNTSNPRVVNSQLNDNELHNCVNKTLTKLRFPATQGGVVQVQYPFVFKSGSY